MAESPESGEEIISLDEESRVNSPSDENQLADVPGFGSGTGHEEDPGLAVKSKDYSRLSDTISISKLPLRKGTRIYKGIQTHIEGLERFVAIKIVAFDPKTLQEVKCLLQLGHHPNVVQIIESKKLEGHILEIYIVMELCSLQNLQDYLEKKEKENTPLDFNKTMSFTRQLMAGMKHIHDHGIIHGDVKPENILLSQDGQSLKISDFGLSKELKYGKFSTYASNRGWGTEAYRAPETFSSDEMTQHADIFSLGITTASLWSNGKHPFGDDHDLWISNIKKNRGHDLSGVLISGPMREELLDLVGKMLQHDPRLRPTMQEILQHPFMTSNFASQSSIFHGTVNFNYGSYDTVKGNKILAAHNLAEKGGKIEYSATDTQFHIAVASSGQAKFDISKPESPKQDSSESQTDTLTLSDQAVSPTEQTIPTEIISEQAEIENSEQDLSEKLTDNLKLSEQAASSAVKITSAGQAEDEFSDQVLSEKRNNNLKLSEQAASSAVKRKTSSGFFGTIRKTFRRKRPVQKEHEKQFTSMTAPGATPSASGSLHAAEMEERAQHLLKEFKLTEVVSLLKDLPPSEEQQTMLAECYLRAGDWSNARNAMNTLKTLMACVSPGSVESVVDSYISDSSYIKALILLPSASCLYKSDKNPNYAVRGLESCSTSCYKIIKALFKQRGRMPSIALEIGYEIILQILADLRSVTGADESIRGCNEADCLYSVGLSLVEIGKLTEAVSFYEQGIEIMKRQFGSNNPKILLGMLLNNLGNTYDSLGDFHKAEESYLQAIQAKKLTKDYSSEEEKRKEIDGSTRNLQNTRGRMTK